MSNLKDALVKARLAHDAGAGFHLSEEDMELILSAAEGFLRSTSFQPPKGAACSSSPGTSGRKPGNLEPGWLMRQLDAAHERAKQLPDWLTRRDKS